MKDVMTLHNEAMDLALQGDLVSKSNPEDERIDSLYTDAFEKEREAALLADFLQNPEPGRSILYRSAASLAKQCGKYREAEQLIAKALSGNPTSEIATELRELLQDIYAQTGQDHTVLVYQFEVPNQDQTRFEKLIRQFGLDVSKIRKRVGQIVL